MRAVAVRQLRSSEAVIPAAPIEAGFLVSRLDCCLQEWRSRDVRSHGFGEHSLRWIQECVFEATEKLDGSALPRTLVNGAMTGFNTHLDGSRIQVTEWRPMYVGHLFTTLARLLSHRSGALARHPQVELARPFVGEWLKAGQPQDLFKEVKAGIIAGSAIQDLAAWEQAQMFPSSAVPS